MKIITLTTDWGRRDYYLAAFKGQLLSKCPILQIVDVSHEVDHFDILQASFIIKNCYDKFPAGSIHFIGLYGNSTKEKPNGYLLVKYNNHFFLGYDNGFFSLALDEHPDKEIYLLNLDENLPYFEINRQMIEIINQLVEETPIEKIGTPTDHYIKVLNASPAPEADTIRGSVIYIDSFQNIISNISAELFEKVGAGRPFTIVMRNQDYTFRKIKKRYGDSDMGEPVVMFNEKGLLELALNQSNAAGLLGIKLFDTIRIEFHNTLNRQEIFRSSPAEKLRNLL